MEQTIKNCRVLSFKLKKTERKAEQLEQEKAEHEKKLLEVSKEFIYNIINPFDFGNKTFMYNIL